jgi:hypothetical protein
MIDLNEVKTQFEQDDGFWLEFPDDKDIKIKIRPLFPDKSNELSRKATKKNHQGAKELDTEKLSKLTVHYIIQDWKGISINGDNTCTNEAKELLSKYCDNIIKFVISKSHEIANAISLQDEEQIKKLKNVLVQS